VQEKEHWKAMRASQCTRIQISLRSSLRWNKYSCSGHECRYIPNCANTYDYGQLARPDCGREGHFLTWREDGEVIYMKVPRGFEKFYPDDMVLKLKKCIYGLKQATMAFWRQLLLCMKSMGMMQRGRRIGPNSVVY
jgi:hypothetical protein